MKVMKKLLLIIMVLLLGTVLVQNTVMAYDWSGDISTVAETSSDNAAVTATNNIAGTVITITLSKGKLKMPEFKSLNEFREWASKYNINSSSIVNNTLIIIKEEQVKKVINLNDNNVKQIHKYIDVFFGD